IMDDPSAAACRYDQAATDLSKAVDLEIARSPDRDRRIAVYLMERQQLDADRSLRAAIRNANATLEERVRSATSKLQLELEDMGDEAERRARTIELRIIEVIALVAA